MHCAQTVEKTEPVSGMRISRHFSHLIQYSHFQDKQLPSVKYACENE